VAVTSTVLDVTVCLLLVSAGAVTVATTAPSATPDGHRPGASDRGQTLATTTATVEFTPRTGSGGNASRSRTRNGTVAALLADAAVRNLSVGRRAVTASRDRFERGVVNATRAAVGTAGVSVVARWRPFAGSSIAGVVAVGPSPPRGADVQAATLRVPSGLPSARGAARRAAERDGFAGVARVLGRRIVAGLFPTGVTAAALARRGEAENASAADLRGRYRRTVTLAGARVAESEDGIDVDRTNARLVAAFAATFERELRRQYETPAAGADAVEVGTVTVVVRTWSR
jgi:hypothetical protein